MTRSIVWRPAARVDLLSLYDWIASQSERETAYHYTSAIEVLIAGLGDFPHLGASSPDLGTAVRTLAFRRRTVIAYIATDTVIEIVALAHAGRDLGAMFSIEED